MNVYIENFETIFGIKNNIQALRNKVLELAIQGKLVEQDPNDEPASELIKRNKLIKEGKIKKQKPRTLINEEEIPFEIPESWEWVRMGDILDIRRGASPRPIKSFVTSEENGVNWIKIGDATKGGKYVTAVNEKITPEGAKKSVYLKPGALIMSNSMSFGKAYILGIDGCIHDGWLSFEFDNELLNSELLQIFLSASYDRFDEKAVGTGVRNLNIDRVRETLIPIAPFTEQYCIVQKVDLLMCEIDKLEESLQKKEHLMQLLPKAVADAIGNCQTGSELKMQLQFLIDNFGTVFQTPESMQGLRNVVLQLAIEGKLVPQNATDEPASELIKKIDIEKEKLVKEGKIKKQKPLPRIEEDEIPFEIPESWKWIKSGNICNVINYGYTASAIERNTETKLLRITDIQYGKVNWDAVPYCEIENDKVGQYKLNENDIVIARTGGTVGKSFIIKNVNMQAVYASYLIRMIPNKHLNPSYYYLMLNTPLYWVQLTEGARGGAQPNVNAQTLSNLILPLPPLAEQNRIVEKVQSIMNLIDQMENKLKRKIDLVVKMVSVN